MTMPTRFGLILVLSILAGIAVLLAMPTGRKAKSSVPWRGRSSRCLRRRSVQAESRWPVSARRLTTLSRRPKSGVHLNWIVFVESLVGEPEIASP